MVGRLRGGSRGQGAACRAEWLGVNGSSWAGPLSIDPADTQAEAASGSGSVYITASCPTSQFCAAVDDEGQVFTFNGTSWSAPKTLSEYGGLTISCPTAGFCLAMDNNGYAYTYSGGAWITHKGVAPAADIAGLEGANYQVSCASASFCADVSLTGTAQTYNGTTWTAPVTIDALAGDGKGDGQLSVSCASAGFCAVISNDSTSYTFNGTLPAHPVPAHSGRRRTGRRQIRASTRHPAHGPGRQHPD